MHSYRWSVSPSLVSRVEPNPNVLDFVVFLNIWPTNNASERLIGRIVSNGGQPTLSIDALLVEI